MVYTFRDSVLDEKSRNALSNSPNKSKFIRDAIEYYVNGVSVGDEQIKERLKDLVSNINEILGDMDDVPGAEKSREPVNREKKVNAPKDVVKSEHTVSEKIAPEVKEADPTVSAEVKPIPDEEVFGKDEGLEVLPVYDPVEVKEPVSVKNEDREPDKEDNILKQSIRKFKLN